MGKYVHDVCASERERASCVVCVCMRVMLVKVYVNNSTIILLTTARIHMHWLHRLHACTGN